MNDATSQIVACVIGGMNSKAIRYKECGGCGNLKCTHKHGNLNEF
jgi:hypothetical protein